MKPCAGRILFWGATALLASSTLAEPVKLRPLSPVYVDAKGTQLDQPQGVGCSATVGLVVADTGNGRILRYRIEDQSLVSAATIVLSQVPHPIRVAFDPSGAILALDGKSRRIARIDTAGRFVGFIEFDGVEGEVAPRSFRVDADGRLWVLDVLSARVLVVDTGGQVQREIAFPEEYGFLSDLTLSGRNVVVVDSVGKRLFIARRDDAVLQPLTESLIEDLDFPTGLDADRQGRLYVADQNGGGIVIFGPNGSFGGRQSKLGWRPGFLRYPSGVCVDAEGRLFVADRGNNRVQPFLIVQ